MKLILLWGGCYFWSVVILNIVLYMIIDKIEIVLIKV